MSRILAIGLLVAQLGGFGTPALMWQEGDGRAATCGQHVGSTQAVMVAGSADCQECDRPVCPHSPGCTGAIPALVEELSARFLPSLLGRDEPGVPLVVASWLTPPIQPPPRV